MAQLDLGTVLLLHKTSLLVGGGTLLLLWARAERPPAVALVAASFGLLALGALLAGLGETGLIPAWVWRDSSAGLGVLAYTMLFLGMHRLDRRIGRLHALPWLALPVLGVGVFTDVFDHNHLRALTFHLTAALGLAASSRAVARHRRVEPLPSRLPLAAVMALTAATYGVQVPLLALGRASPATLAFGFAATLMLNFAIAALLVSFVRERREALHRQVAVTDALTGVDNRHGFHGRVPSVLAAGAALAIVDLDRFKLINDHFGHAGGDHALVAVAELLRRRLCRGEVLARIGGEEFVIYVPAGKSGRARALALDVRAAIADAALSWEGEPMPVSVSIGLAVATEAAAREALLMRADRALYRAKADGRDRVVESLAVEAGAALMPQSSPV